MAAFISAYQHISSVLSLKKAWNSIEKRTRGYRRDTRGIDLESINNFHRDSDNKIELISNSLRRNTPYVFSPLRAVLIDKADGKLRVICVPTIRDRIIQRSILEYLSQNDKCKLINDISYGFIKSIPGSPVKNVKSAVTRAKQLRKNYPWVYKTDITSFFDQIERTNLIKIIKSAVKTKSLHQILESTVRCEILEPSRSRQDKIKKQGILHGRGIRQGMPLSPFFANLVLRDFDSKIIKNGYKAIRYADDLIFFSKDNETCYKIHEFCRDYLKSIGHTIPELGEDTKTQIIDPMSPAVFLGMGLSFSGTGYTLIVTEQQLKKIRNKILLNSSIKDLVANKITLSKIGTKINSELAGYLNAYEYADNHEQVYKCLRKWKTEVFKKIFENQLGINITSLGREEIIFLELENDFYN